MRRQYHMEPSQDNQLFRSYYMLLLVHYAYSEIMRHIKLQLITKQNTINLKYASIQSTQLLTYTR